MPSPFAVILALLVFALVPTARSGTAAPEVRSGAAFVIDDESGTVLFAKNALSVQPIASITKLMTAMVVLDAKLDPDERIQIIENDKSRVKWASSRLRVGSILSRDDLLRIALMASENRAASALARTYPGGETALLAAMNLKAKNMGLASTRFDDPTGLSSGNVSTASELATLVRMARRYPIVSEYSTLHEHTVKTKYGAMAFANTNRLVRGNNWNIDLSKTGFIAEAGRCLVMHLSVGTRPVTLVLLDASGRFTPFADAQRIRRWLEPGYTSPSKAAMPRPYARSGAAG
ncbi:MAG: D-alanyl-D-alanine endopeptidase [Burkholderiales bacterium]